MDVITKKTHNGPFWKAFKLAVPERIDLPNIIRHQDGKRPGRSRGAASIPGIGDEFQGIRMLSGFKMQSIAAVPYRASGTAIHPTPKGGFTQMHGHFAPARQFRLEAQLPESSPAEIGEKDSPGGRRNRNGFTRGLHKLLHRETAVKRIHTPARSRKHGRQSAEQEQKAPH
jgi:hypothetical protein